MIVIEKTWPFMLFGICEEKPTLPDGWKVIEKEEEWMRCESPDGKPFYLCEEILIPIINDKGWCDPEQKINIPDLFK